MARSPRRSSGPINSASSIRFDRSKFQSKVLVDERGCWIWTGSVTDSGYGKLDVRIGDNWQCVRAHRLSYMLFVDDIPQGLLVCHRCDVRACVNPEHLFLGTDRDNSYDCIDKGRQRTICKPKLTVEQVVEIRNSNEGQSALAVQYGVAPQTIWKIRAGQRWRRAS